MIRLPNHLWKDYPTIWNLDSLRHWGFGWSRRCGFARFNGVGSQSTWLTRVLNDWQQWIPKDGTLNILKLTSLHSKCVKLLWAIDTNSWNMMKYVEMMFTQNVCLFSREFGRDFIWFYRGVAHSRSDSGTRQYNMLHERNQLWQVFSEPALPRTSPGSDSNRLVSPVDIRRFADNERVEAGRAGGWGGIQRIHLRTRKVERTQQTSFDFGMAFVQRLMFDFKKLIACL